MQSNDVNFYDLISLLSHSFFRTNDLQSFFILLITFKQLYTTKSNNYFNW